MMRRILFVVCFIVAVGSLRAQDWRAVLNVAFAPMPAPAPGTTVVRPGDFPYVEELIPQAVPNTTMTTVYNNDAYLCHLDIHATGGQTVTVEDKQGTPVVFIADVIGTSGPVAGTFIFNATDPYNCRHFIGGIQWQASATGVTGYMVIRHQ